MMSTHRKGNIASRRLRDEVELLKTKKTKDKFGVRVSTSVSLGKFHADVEQIHGGRLAYYQSLGYTHPMNITIRDPEVEFEQMCYQGRELKIKSQITDPDNTNFIRIMADYTDVSKV